MYEHMYAGYCDCEERRTITEELGKLGLPPIPPGKQQSWYVCIYDGPTGVRACGGCKECFFVFGCTLVKTCLCLCLCMSCVLKYVCMYVCSCWFADFTPNRDSFQPVYVAPLALISLGPSSGRRRPRRRPARPVHQQRPTANPGPSSWLVGRQLHHKPSRRSRGLRLRPRMIRLFNTWAIGPLGINVCTLPSTPSPSLSTPSPSLCM